jgi:molybdate transport system regulatory protein
MGPGKADLLEAILATGSISAAGRRLGMSYRRAWLLVDAMNHAFTGPLVEAHLGGAGGGGAQVTELGLEALKRYRDLQDQAWAAVRRSYQDYCRLLMPE